MTKRDPNAAASQAGRSRGKVVECFDSFASSYGERRYFEVRRAAVFELLPPYLDKAARILDLGCGNGIYLVQLCKLEKPHRHVGMDLSLGMLAKAGQRLGDRADLVRGDAIAVPFKAGCLDLVICSHVLLFVKELGRRVADITRSLRPGGLLVVTTAPNLLVRLRRIFGEKIFAEFDRAAAGSPVAGEPTTSEEGYRLACSEAGLHVRQTAAHFGLEQPIIKESLRSILARFAKPGVVQRTLDALQTALPADAGLPLTEPMLLATKAG
jgi:ubiquinone/menaquinone biosynthesis C-methylase UbiE